MPHCAPPMSSTPSIDTLMLEPEIESLVSFIGCCSKIGKSLFFSHCFPFLCSGPVTPHIVQLREDIDNDVHAGDAEEGTIAMNITRSITYPSLVSNKPWEQNGELLTRYVDVGGDDTASLDEHVVACC